MKIYLTPILAVVLLMSACGNREAEQKKFAFKLDSLNTAIVARDSTVNNLLSSFNEIKENLDSVAIRQNIISGEAESQKGELKGNTKSQINSQITAINDLMNQNRKKIQDLNRKLKKSSLKINQFQKMIANLNEEIAQKNTELQTLNEKLNAVNAQVAQLQTSVDTLSTINTSQSQMIANQTTSLHTAYYLVGKSKDLEKMKIIDKAGGILGMGKTSKLNADLDKSNFTRIDYTQILSIPINSKKAKIITAHPSDSYLLDKENDEITNLRIIQPEKFWSASKYLVVLKG